MPRSHRTALITVIPPSHQAIDGSQKVQDTRSPYHAFQTACPGSTRVRLLGHTSRSGGERSHSQRPWRSREPHGRWEMPRWPRPSHSQTPDSDSDGSLQKPRAGGRGCSPWGAGKLGARMEEDRHPQRTATPRGPSPQRTATPRGPSPQRTTPQRKTPQRADAPATPASLLPGLLLCLRCRNLVVFPGFLWRI